MKTTRALFGITGSILVLIYAIAMVFFGQNILPSSIASKFDPDSFILLISGLLGLFGGFIGAAGSALSFYSEYRYGRRPRTAEAADEGKQTFRGDNDLELSGILLLGAAVSGAVMFAGLSVLFSLIYITWLNRYAALATGIAAFILLSISGVASLAARKKS